MNQTLSQKLGFGKRKPKTHPDPCRNEGVLHRTGEAGRATLLRSLLPRNRLGRSLALQGFAMDWGNQKKGKMGLTGGLGGAVMG